MKREHLKSVQLKYRKSADTSLPLREQYRKRPYVLFTFQDPDTGERYTKTQVIKHIDLYADPEGGVKLAEEYFRVLRNKLALDTLDLRTIFPVRQRIGIKEFFYAYMEEREKAVNRGSLSPETLRADVCAINRFVKVLGAKYPLQAVTEKSILEYVDGQLAGGYARSTVNIDLRHLGAAFGKAAKGGIIEANPFSDVKKLRVEKIPRHLWPEEEEALREYFRALGIVHQADFYEFDLSTGLRSNEMFEANISQLRPAASGPELRVLGKGNKWRWVPVSRAEEIILRRRELLADERRLKDYIGDLKSVNKAAAMDRAREGNLFFEITEETTAPQFILRARQRCKLPDKVTTHSLRHTFAVRFLEQRRGDIYLLSQLLGHSSVTVTEIYLHCSPALRQMYNVR